MVYTASIRASVPLNMPIGYSRMKVEETGELKMRERAETFGFQLFGDAEIVLLLPIGSICSETISGHPKTLVKGAGTCTKISTGNKALRFWQTLVVGTGFTNYITKLNTVKDYRKSFKLMFEAL